MRSILSGFLAAAILFLCGSGAHAIGLRMDWPGFAPPSCNYYGCHDLGPLPEHATATLVALGLVAIVIQGQRKLRKAADSRRAWVRF